MELKKLVLATAMCSALGGLYGCSGDEKVNIVIDDNSTVDDNSVTTTTTTTSTTGSSDNDGFYDDADAIAASITAIAGASEKTVVITNPETGDEVAVTAVQLPNTILEDVTLDADVLYYMADRVTVGDGNGSMTETDGVLDLGSGATADVTSVTFTIEAGTQILAAKNTFANLLITRGSQIMAEGTAEAPIVFSSDDDDMDGSGEWGGIIIHGYGLHNECTYEATATACNIDAEGESGLAGGHDNTDSSGVLNYVVVAEGGYEFAVGNEINGISFVGVGSGTEIDYVQVHNNADDGVEFYGGAVSAKHLVLTGNQDDSIDWDEGYVGNIQYALVVQSDATGGNAVEADTEGSTDFLSEPTIVNATLVTAGSKTTSIVLKASSGGYFHNTVITGASGTIGECVQLSGTGAQDNASTGSIVFNQIIADCTTFEIDADSAETTLLVDSGNAISINSVAASLDTNWASTAAEASGVTAADVESYSSETNAAFFDDTTFIGAVNPDGSDLWYEGWIVEESL